MPQSVYQSGEKANVSAIVRQVYRDQAEALLRLARRVEDDNFERAVSVVMAAKGRLIICGVGKSGIIGRKMAATLASTGTPTFFVHPTEAFHGDLGMITPDDVVLLISYSGETEEVLKLIPSLKRQGVVTISMTGKPASTLARNTDVHLDVSCEREVCPHNLAPTTSTTTTIATGDALAVALMLKRNFQPQDFARFHPGGSLGKRLLTRVQDVMHTDPLPVVSPQANFQAVVHEITRGRLGLVVVVDQGKVVGLITDGDLRRGIEGASDINALTADDLMTREPVTVTPEVMFAEAEQSMRNAKVKSLVVCGVQGECVGVVEIYDV